MSRSLRIGVVDQSPVYDGRPAAEALRRSVELAKRCEAAGYSRYWVAEHHNTPSYASPAPEILIAAIASQTRQIRVGSGGVMLSHYSPLKVAETFSSLQALFPGRIDLGVGRAPGGSSLSTHALAYPGFPSGGELYSEQLADLLALVRNQLPDGHQYQGLRAMPGTETPPAPWVLGSGSGSTRLAASLGAGFVLALFIGTDYRSPEIIRSYRKAFRPGGFGDQPSAMLATAVICADSMEEAKFVASTHTYWKLQAHLHGNREGLRPPEEVQTLYRQLSPSDRAYFDETLRTMILGTPGQCRDQLELLSDEYAVDEILAINVTYRFSDRVKCYEELAKVMELNPEHSAPALTRVG
ncbi:LLM class flavin-dependent oxidoreductase [Marinobacterium sp. D7]|uniref:LLM class flavin-dependent oxidoreductase n=1 Tax=Marinobacterium ramblicola TaxID=2849041 RepID=UPI001C2CE8A9|nr:LLM class flavin-dependent oxidoreductase [Marinobacterium ramblicola]MBV1789212.1 LLM class flavin-dependent oxidoreductase [Marinobacterium ramblicola]